MLGVSLLFVQDALTEDTLAFVCGRRRQHEYPALCPVPLIALAAWVCPF